MTANVFIVKNPNQFQRCGFLSNNIFIKTSHFLECKQTLEKPEGTIKSRQPRQHWTHNIE